MSTDTATLTPADIEAWLRFAQEPGLPHHLARALLAAASSPSRLYSGDAARPAWLPDALARQLAQPPSALLAQRMAHARQWLAATDRRRLIPLTHPLYPEPLRQLADAPLLLYMEGNIEALSRPALAVVGARQATPVGRQNAEAFARALAGTGWVVVSGLARGIDGAAHEGALAGANPGQPATIAVLGSGPDIIYPRAHATLARRIVEQGALLSDYPPGTPPLAAHFPRRNRLVAGLTQGTLVIEAAAHSGSLITARLAAEYGREVFALPGSIHSPLARGCHTLIQEGAKLVSCLTDILEELPTSPQNTAQQVRLPPPTKPPALSPAARTVLASLDDTPLTLDSCLMRCGLTTADALTALWELEQLGLVARTDCGGYQRQPDPVQTPLPYN